jgi:phenylacetate-coenzyme A ligase PaaK-like adenylate-forming protein
LLATLRHVKEASPFYSKLLCNREITEENMKDTLESLPTLTADEWSAIRGEIRTGKVTPGTQLGFTSGTTSFLPKAFLETVEERQALDALGDIFEKDETQITLNLYSNKHGSIASHGGREGTVSVPLESRAQFEQVLGLLTRSEEPYSAFPKVSRIVGTLLNIKKLTVELSHREIDTRAFEIRELVVFAHLLTPRWRARLEETWGAKVTELYGCSEMRIANATRCAECSHYHMPPWSYAECLDTRTCRPSPVPGTVGSIAVTAFFPFKQLEPRLRYRPGDLIQVASEACPETGEPGFEVLGRESRALWSSRAGQWLTTRGILNELDAFCEINRANTKTFESLDLHDVECGSPRYQTKRSDGGEISLAVELRFDPAFWKKATQCLREALLGRLGDLVDTIEFCGPGQLGPDSIQL